METSHLIVRDRTGDLSNEQVKELADAARKTLNKILEFWSTGPRVQKFGKIRVDLERPRGKHYASVFLWGEENGRKVRVVKIFGVDKEPQMVAHKLTHAVFPNPDKLIRNMMGIPMEIRFGNPKAFPMCGFSNEDWVLALDKINSHIPMTELGPNHDQWGMGTRDGLPVVIDKARQHAAYAESGSFGSYLLDAFGIERVKQFNRLSRGKKRPWMKVFGLTLAELERDWIESLYSTQKDDKKDILFLTEFLRKNPNAVV